MSRFASFRSVFTSGFAALSIKLRLIAAVRLTPVPSVRGKLRLPASCARPIPTTTNRIPITCAAPTTNNWQLATAA